ncbi:SulP family inorganic anion transporter [Candidatus Nomurabacteria bacterium]|nr:SulP family inorganic anion transporter [Candidatus Kaiserbacteria bacterium]MCB9813812.1 SulP family inorganic anion transporter [Candidatus Nomurabacteria bacterium]
MTTNKDILKNVVAGLTVSFVALSLGAAFGILSGRGAFAGMLSSALIATVTSVLGGTRIQCSGPTGPMTAATATLIALAHDTVLNVAPGVNPDHLVNMGILLGGFFMIMFGVLRLGKYITIVPNVVISGFMNGIAIIIWLDQIKRLFGLGGKTAIGGLMWENIVLAGSSVFFVFFFQQIVQKAKSRIYGLFSGTLITLFLMTLIAYFLFPDIERVSLVGSIKNIGDITTLVTSQIPTEWTWGLVILLTPFALQMAVLGYLDTLMTSLVIDKMNKEKTKANKELVAQGVSNSLVALVGGIPGAQATIRSVLMVKEKASMRLAGILVGVFAFIEMIIFQDLVNLIPQAVFSGILLKVGYDVFDWLPVKLYLKEIQRGPIKLLKNFFSRHDYEKIFVTNREMIIILGTASVTVLFNLNAAVAIFTIIFYLHNKVLVRHNPMRDLKPKTETEVFIDEL